MDNYICINKQTGINILNPINMSNIYEYKQECDRQNGKFIKKDDYLSPNDEFICSIGNKKYYSKNDCNNAQLNSEDVIYKQKQEPSDKFSNVMFPFEVREASRLRTTLVFMFLFTLALFLWYIIIKNQVSNAGERLFWAYVVIMVIIYIITITFCPFHLCVLEPDSNKFVKSPLQYMYNNICRFFNIFGFDICYSY